MRLPTQGRDSGQATLVHHTQHRQADSVRNKRSHRSQRSGSDATTLQNAAAAIGSGIFPSHRWKRVRRVSIATIRIQLSTLTELTKSDTGNGETTRAFPAKLTVRNLNFHYGSFQALHGVSMEVFGNRVTALIGSSGCGKTTLLRTFNRMNETVPESRIEGEVLLESENILQMDVSVLRRRVGMVFQKSNPFPRSIFENVAYGPRIDGLKNRAALRDTVEKALRRAALWDEVKDRLSRSAWELSGGQRQRLCIARALAIEPEVLLLDEPCAGLDPAATAKIEESVLTLKDSCTIVIVTHNLEQARRVAHYTGYFLPGRLIEFDTTSTIFENPARKETKDYVHMPFRMVRQGTGSGLAGAAAANDFAASQ
jgi:phosphate transport system ATP-binding protein